MPVFFLTARLRLARPSSDFVDFQTLVDFCTILKHGVILSISFDCN